MQEIITGIIVAAALAYTLWAIYRRAKRKGGRDCSCGSAECGACDLCNGRPEHRRQNRKKGK